MPSLAKSNETPAAASENRPRPAARGRRTLKEIDVKALFEDGREVLLLHRGEAYSLRITANGKLILTK